MKKRRDSCRNDGEQHGPLAHLTLGCIFMFLLLFLRPPPSPQASPSTPTLFPRIPSPSQLSFCQPGWSVPASICRNALFVNFDYFGTTFNLRLNCANGIQEDEMSIWQEPYSIETVLQSIDLWKLDSNIFPRYIFTELIQGAGFCFCRTVRNDNSEYF